MRRAFVPAVSIGLGLLLGGCSPQDLINEPETTYASPDSPTSPTTESSQPSASAPDDGEAPSGTSAPASSDDTAPNDPGESEDSMLSDSERAAAMQDIRGQADGAPQFATIGLRSTRAQLAARCEGKGSLRLVGANPGGDQAVVGESQVVPCTGERYDIVLEPGQPFTAVLVETPPGSATYEVAILSAS